MYDNITYYKYYGSIIVIVSALLHNVIFFDYETLFITGILIYGWWLITHFVITPEKLKYFPVSTIMICGLSLIHFLLPMPLMLMAGRPMAFNLRVPFDTFLHHGIFVTTIVFSHIFYTGLSAGKNIFRSFLVKTDFYKQPSDKLIWCTAIAGLLGVVYGFFVFGALSSDVSDRGFLYYLSTIFSQYLWMPVILLFSGFRSEENSIKKSYLYVFAYVLIISIIAISSNMRTLLFSGLIIAFSLMFIGFMLGFYRADKVFGVKKVVMAFLGLILIGGPVVDFGYAMIAVRGDRANMSAGELITETLRIYNDDDALGIIKQSVKIDQDTNDVKTFAWDEKYFDNIIINRYVNFKIADNSVFYAGEIGYENIYIKEELKAQVAALLPNVILGFLNYDISKKNDTASYSIGDYVYSIAINNNNVLGSFIITSMPGIGLAAFGYWYPVVVFLLFVIIFPMFDSFAITHNDKIYFSYYFFVSIIIILNYFNDRHAFVFEFRYIIRTYFESVAMFLLVTFLFNAIIDRKTSR